PLFLFSLHYGDAVAGQYAMASRLIWAPAILLAGSLAQVLYHAYASRVGPVAPTFLLLPHRLYYVVLLSAPFLCYAMREIIVLLLGGKWRLAADIMPVMLAWACCFIASTPARVVCRMMEQQKYHLLIDACMLGAIFTLLHYLQLTALQSMYGILLIACAQNLGIVVTSLRAIRRAGA
ncbi:MAG TPA: hypothetical protein VFS95_05085, partial [Telluria sp.]|nr:hypothetical protein [Telluria sp.]